MEDERFILFWQQCTDLLYTRCRYAEHGHAHECPIFLLFGNRVLHHARQRMGRIAQYLARNNIEPLYIGYGRHHADIGCTHVGCHIAGGNRGHHKLRESHRQSAHAACHDGRIAGTAESYYSADIFLMFHKEFFEQGPH